MRELLDDQLTEEQPQTPQKSIALAFILHILTGTGMLYFDKKLIRGRVYFACFLYAWLSFINIFTWSEMKIGFRILERFHNHSAIGGYSIFLCWGFVYLIGTIDVLLRTNAQSKI